MDKPNENCSNRWIIDIFDSIVCLIAVTSAWGSSLEVCATISSMAEIDAIKEKAAVILKEIENAG